MTDDPYDPLALLAHDVDEPVPDEHAARIRAGLEPLLAATPDPIAARGSTPSKASPTSLSLAPATAASTTSWAIKVLPLALATFIGGAAGFALGRSTAPSAEATPAPSSVASLAVPVPVPTPVYAPADGAAPDSALDGSPQAVPFPASTRGSSTSDTPSGFDREQSLLERARTALARHDADGAQRALEAVDREFVRPRHAEERDYLQLLVHAERGDRARVRAGAAAFLQRYPKSLLRTRLEALLGDGDSR